MGSLCDTCYGVGLVWVNLRSFRFGAGFAAFMTAGCEPRYNEDGSVWHQLVCPACDGRGAGGSAAGASRSCGEGGS